MGTSIYLHIASLSLLIFLNLGTSIGEDPFSEAIQEGSQLDTIPIVNPTTPGFTNPTTPGFTNPTAPPTQPIPTGPTITPTTPITSGGGGGGGSWCIASPSASSTALQVALDYACGYGGAECSGIQPGSSCYEPNTVKDHASYAFNDYYQKNPAPTSCMFGGAAQLTNTDPSSGNCHYASSKSTPSPIIPNNPPTIPTPLPPMNPTPMPPTPPTMSTPTDSIPTDTTPTDTTPTDAGGFGSEPSDTASSAMSISSCFSFISLGSLLIASLL